MDCGVFVCFKYLELVNGVIIDTDNINGLSIDEVCKLINSYGNHLKAYRSIDRNIEGIYIIYLKRNQHFMLVENDINGLFISDQYISHLRIPRFLYRLIYQGIILIDLDRYKV